MGERLERIVFLVCIAVLGVAYGTAAAMFNFFPYPQVQSARWTLVEIITNWRNDFGFVPTRHLTEGHDPEREPFRLVVPDLVSPGYVLIGGLTPNHPSFHGGLLYDAAGTEVHYWPLNYEVLVPEDEPETNVLLHGLAPLPDTSIVVAFDNGDVLARVDACGDAVWVRRGGYHHAVTATEDGKALWTLDGDNFVKIDADTGEDLVRFSLREDVIAAHGLYGELAIRSMGDADEFRYQGDPFHLNDVEALPASMADAFPMFEAGDLLISMRELNLVGVLDPDERRFRWYAHGPWFKQHDPDFLPEGRISIYDNRTGLPPSRIRIFDPARGTTEDLITGTGDLPFYSWRRGKHHTLPNGHILIAESERGRVFETTPDGRLVWERHQIYDETRNAVITSADYLGPDFFTSPFPDCDAE